MQRSPAGSRKSTGQEGWPSCPVLFNPFPYISPCGSSGQSFSWNRATISRSVTAWAESCSLAAALASAVATLLCTTPEISPIPWVISSVLRACSLVKSAIPLISSLILSGIDYTIEISCFLSDDMKRLFVPLVKDNFFLTRGVQFNALGKQI